MALSLPLLTRLYAPEDFSLLAVYMAIVGIIATISCLRLNIAIPLPELDQDGMALVALSLLASTIISGILALPVIFAPTATAVLLGQPAMAPYLWMIPLGIWIASVYMALQYWASRRKQFKLITQTRISRAVGGAGTQIGFGVADPGPFGLLFGHMIYGGLGIFGLACSIWIRERSTLDKLSWSRMQRVLQLYRRFPIWSVPEALFNTAAVQLPILIIASIAIGPEAGFLMLAMRVMGVPMGLIGASVGQVYLAEAPQKLRDGTLLTFTRKTMWILLKTGGIPLVLVGMVSPFVFGPIFGAEWERAGILVAWMTPWFLLQFVVSPVSTVLNISGHFERAMFLNLAGLILRIAGVSIAAVVAPNFLSEIYAITGAMFCLAYIATVLCSLKTIKNR